MKNQSLWFDPLERWTHDLPTRGEDAKHYIADAVSPNITFIHIIHGDKELKVSLRFYYYLCVDTTAVYTGRRGGGVQNVHHIHRNRNTGKLVGLAYGG